MAEIPDYNKIDSDNDTIEVIEAKIAAIRKQRQELNDAEEALKQEALEKFGKPLGEWP